MDTKRKFFFSRPFKSVFFVKEMLKPGKGCYQNIILKFANMRVSLDISIYFSLTLVLSYSGLKNQNIF
jgi:hypothetical protein